MPVTETPSLSNIHSTNPVWEGRYHWGCSNFVCLLPHLQALAATFPEHYSYPIFHQFLPVSAKKSLLLGGLPPGHVHSALFSFTHHMLIAPFTVWLSGKQVLVTSCAMHVPHAWHMVGTWYMIAESRREQGQESYTGKFHLLWPDSAAHLQAV